MTNRRNAVFFEARPVAGDPIAPISTSIQPLKTRHQRVVQQRRKRTHHPLAAELSPNIIDSKSILKKDERRCQKQLIFVGKALSQSWDHRPAAHEAAMAELIWQKECADETHRDGKQDRAKPSRANRRGTLRAVGWDVGTEIFSPSGRCGVFS
jgi:hypothetical protein